MTKKEIDKNIEVLDENGIALISNDEDSYEFEALIKY